MNIFKKSRRKNSTNKGIEKHAEHYDNIYARPYNISNYIPVFEKAIEFIHDFSNDVECKIIDIGCGIGGFAKMLKTEKFHNYLGFDFSKTAVEKAKKNIPDWSDKFMIYDVYQLNQIIFDYDIAIAIEVLEHIQDLELIKNLKKNSILIGSVPNFWSSGGEHLRVYRSKFFIWWRYRKKLEFLKWYKHNYTKRRFIYIFSARIK